MTPAELKAHGLHECPDCLTRHDSESALLYCCNPTFDKPGFLRGYELGYD